MRVLVLSSALIGASAVQAVDDVTPTLPATPPPGEAAPTPADPLPAPVPPEAPVPEAPSPPAAASTTSTTPAPRIADLAVAADNPAAAPVISLTVEPVGSATTLWWRAPGAAWASVDMAGTGTAMRLARLPDGLQQKGFAFYVDVVGPGGRARFGSRASPIEVDPAVEGNVDRTERDARDAAAFVGPHPALVMMALGTGVLAGAGAGAFGYDLVVVQNRIANVDAALAANPPAEERGPLEAERAGLERARLQDTTATVLLGVVGGVALATGVTLLVVGAVEQ